MGDCDDCCSEHPMRVEIARRTTEDIANLNCEVEALRTSISERRDIIDRKLEIGVEKFAALENGQRILLGVLVVLISLSGYAYTRASDAYDGLNSHKAEDKGEFNVLKGHIDFHAQAYSKEERQEEDVHNLKAIAAGTEQALKNIELRLGNIEKKM